MLNIRIATPPWDHQEQYLDGGQPGRMFLLRFAQKPGDKVTISGRRILYQTDKKEMVYIGGGAGMVLRSHLPPVPTLKTKDRKVSYWYGDAPSASCSTPGLPRDRAGIRQLQLQHRPVRREGRQRGRPLENQRRYQR